MTKYTINPEAGLRIEGDHSDPKYAKFLADHKWIPWGHDLIDGYFVPDQDCFDILFEGFEHLKKCTLRDTARWISEITGRPIHFSSLRKLKDDTYASRERPSKRPAA